jgi:hypothetical protein
MRPGCTAGGTVCAPALPTHAIRIIAANVQAVVALRLIGACRLLPAKTVPTLRPVNSKAL